MNRKNSYRDLENGIELAMRSEDAITVEHRMLKIPDRNTVLMKLR